ncbi:MAG: hypothetical protein ACLUI3_15215 [Christensenellales bacterium]
MLITDKPSPITCRSAQRRGHHHPVPDGHHRKLGLLKMDFLGLRTLTVIRDALDLMRDAGVDMKAEDIRWTIRPCTI